MDETLDLLRKYREGAEGTSDPVPKRANASHDRMRAAYRKLRETSEGKSGIIALMGDANPHVRCWAASHSLTWEQDKARAVLEALRNFKGACSFDAGIVLEEFDNGKLTFD